MSKFSSVRRLCAALLLSAACATLVSAQDKKPKADAKKADAKKADEKKTDGKPKVSKLFKSEAPLDITLTANFRQLRKEKQQGAPYHPATIAYTDSAGKSVTVPLRVRTRGLWRLQNCDFPPLRLNFANKTSKASVFDDLDEPKLVSYCKRGVEAEQFVLRELQLYRTWRLLSPNGHETRLLRITYVDSATGKPEMTRYAFVVEDPKRMAERVGARILERKGAGPEDLEPEPAALAFVYLYMVGNTDFSFSSLHNGELLAFPGGKTLPVPYDFDFAGAINAPYAAPAPGLRIRNVRERQFRGYCLIKDAYPVVVAELQAKKPAIYALYSDTVGALIDKRITREMLQYFDSFYEDVKTPKDIQRNLISECTDKN